VVAVQESERKLVPGRSCGNCVVCCYVLNIDAPELKKPPGTICSNCSGKGCRIYAARPTVCQEYYCGWWYAAELGEDWRPDKSGVVIGTRSDFPADSGFRTGWEFNVFGGEVAIRRVGFVEMIVSLVNRGVPALLTASGPMGAPCAAIILNDHLKDAVKRNDLRAALSLLIAIHRQLLDHAYTEVSNSSSAARDRSS
jgi:hypothetical protein